MKFERTEVMNFENAIRGMRNPMDSWDKSDSAFGYDYIGLDAIETNRGNIANVRVLNVDNNSEIIRYAAIGPNDLDLMQRLIRGGSEHRKFMRQIFVSVDITAPLFWWKEADTYQVGVTKNSTSTMHKLSSKPITIDDFEIDDLCEDIINNTTINKIISFLEELRLMFIETKDKKYWKELIRWLPESYLQTRTVTMNYENIYSMIRQRMHHKLNEWSGKDDSSKQNFIDWARSLPYADELLFLDIEEKD